MKTLERHVFDKSTHIPGVPVGNAPITAPEEGKGNPSRKHMRDHSRKEIYNENMIFSELKPRSRRGSGLSCNFMHHEVDYAQIT